MDKDQRIKELEIEIGTLKLYKILAQAYKDLHEKGVALEHTLSKHGLTLKDFE